MYIIIINITIKEIRLGAAIRNSIFSELLYLHIFNYLANLKSLNAI